MQVYKNIIEAIGRTPIIELNRISEGTGCKIWGKFEGINIGGSIKSRSALGMIEAAEKDGTLKAGGTIIEASTGNQGIGAAMLAAAKGYRCIIVMSEVMGEERRQLIKAYGATVVLSPKGEDMKSSVRKAREMAQYLHENIPNSVFLRQFDNPANSDIHRRTTAAEILVQTGGRFDAFVSTIGSGGTITGVGEVLAMVKPDLRIFAAEPRGASLKDKAATSRAHKQQGIGDGQLTKLLNREIIEEWIEVTDDDAFNTARRLAKEEGLLGGITSGTAVYASLVVAKKLGSGKTILTILPDTGERYLMSDVWPPVEEIIGIPPDLAKEIEELKQKS